MVKRKGEVHNAVLFMVAAIAVVAVVMAVGLTIGREKLSPIGDLTLRALGIYHITIHNEEEFRGLLQCIVAGQMFFDTQLEERILTLAFEDLEDTEMAGCTLKGKAPTKINIDFEIEDSRGYIILGSGELEPEETGFIQIPNLIFKDKNNNEIWGDMPISTEKDCFPVKTLRVYTAGESIIVGTVIKEGQVEQQGVPLECHLEKGKGAVESVRIYDGTKAQMTVQKGTFLITMEIKDHGIAEKEQEEQQETK